MNMNCSLKLNCTKDVLLVSYFTKLSDHAIIFKNRFVLYVCMSVFFDKIAYDLLKMNRDQILLKKILSMLELWEKKLT